MEEWTKYFIEGMKDIKDDVFTQYWEEFCDHDPVILKTPADLDFSMLGTIAIKIVGAHNRGMSVKKLNKLKKFIWLHANKHGQLKWLDLTPAPHPNVGRLNAHWINLYQVREPKLHCQDTNKVDCLQMDGWVIRAATQKVKSSLVELMCVEGEDPKPSWFVSHWWG